jgi:hypothetical protein
MALVWPSNGVDISTMVKRRLLGLTDGGDGHQMEKMQVIGAGFGRTGTESLCAALTMLGYKTYHGTKAIRFGHLPAWNDFLENGNVEVFNALEKEGFNATTDFPASTAYKTFMALNPKSKVVLSVHPRGSKGWAKSFLTTLAPLGEIVVKPPFKYLKPFQEYKKMAAKVKEVVAIEVGGDGKATEEGLAKAYDTWIEAVKSAVPPDRLLVFSPIDGWEPLCAFLDLERGAGVCPAEGGEPYPRVNDSEDLRRQINTLGTIASIWPVAAPALLALVLALVVGCCRRGGKRRPPSSTDQKRD